MTGLRVRAVECHHSLEQGLSLAVVFALEIDQPEVQQNGLVFGIHLERASVNGDRFFGTMRALVDDSEIPHRGDLIRGGGQHSLKAALGGSVVPCREILSRLLEDRLEWIGRYEARETQSGDQ